MCLILVPFTSVFDFFENKYPLTGLEIRDELNGKTFGELTPELQASLEDKTLRTFELAQTTPKDLMFLIFERLNTGGMALNDMEIRNCLYRGRLNDRFRLANHMVGAEGAPALGLVIRISGRTTPPALVR